MEHWWGVRPDSYIYFFSPQRHPIPNNHFSFYNTKKNLGKQIFAYYRWCDNLLFIIFSVLISIHNRKIVPYCFKREAWEPVRTARSQINLYKWPLHCLCSLTLFPSISNYAKPDIWIVKTFLDPLKTLEFPHFPWAVNWRNK